MIRFLESRIRDPSHCLLQMDTKGFSFSLSFAPQPKKEKLVHHPLCSVSIRVSMCLALSRKRRPPKRCSLLRWWTIKCVMFSVVTDKGVGNPTEETILDSKGKGAYRKREEGGGSWYLFLFDSTVRKACHFGSR